jgi:cob(I)alamin adenosyltransferase
LRGHKTFVHGDGSSSSGSATQVATEPQLSKLEERLEKLESVTGLREVSILDKILSNEKPLTEKLAEVTQQLNSLTQQLVSISNNNASNTDLHKISERITQLAQQLSSHNKWFQPIRTVAGTMSHLEDELSNRAQNTRVDALENRIAHLEEEVQGSEGKIIKCMENNKVLADAQIGKIMECIEGLVDRFATSIKQIQSQLKEQKQVTDWVRKEYNLRPVKKAS